MTLNSRLEKHMLIYVLDLFDGGEAGEAAAAPKAHPHESVTVTKAFILHHTWIVNLPI